MLLDAGINYTIDLRPYSLYMATMNLVLYLISKRIYLLMVRLMRLNLWYIV